MKVDNNDNFLEKKEYETIKKDMSNYIIGIYNIQEKDLNQQIQILNYHWNNKKEIECSCEIYMNNEKINFNYMYNFSKQGQYIFKFVFKKLLINSSCLFFKCFSLISINLTYFKTNEIINMHGMFNGCISLQEIELSNIVTNNVKDMSYMFCNCSSLNKLDLSNFNTSNVTNMSNMFRRCSSLNYLNLSSFNVNNVNNMSCIFSHLNKYCNIISDNEKILNKVKKEIDQ